jgi:hypothetical protein
MENLEEVSGLLRIIRIQAGRHPRRKTRQIRGNAIFGLNARGMQGAGFNSSLVDGSLLAWEERNELRHRVEPFSMGTSP